MILFRKKSDLIIRRDDLKKNKFKIGDDVKIIESRPYSKLKK